MKLGKVHRVRWSALPWSDRHHRVTDNSGETKTVPFNMTWTPAIPKTRVVVHAGKLLDMKSPTMRSNVDVIVTGNRITSVVPHAEANHLKAEVVDASNLTVMPGFTEFHSHLQKDYGAAQGRAWLAFGITTVRSPGNTPYEAVEDREANEAGVRPGPQGVHLLRRDGPALRYCFLRVDRSISQ